MLDPDPPECDWIEATSKAIPLLGLTSHIEDIESILLQTLGEAQYGSNHWQLSKAKRLYYELKPFIPPFLIKFLK
jgi:hypothetical protein